jgi:hypothetical protein
LLVENDRVTTGVSTIAANVISPVIRAKHFPENLNNNFLDLFFRITKISFASKIWKKDTAELFNDPRFFNASIELVDSGLLSIIGQWVQSEKDVLAEYVSRITPPTTAGIVFGVGATSARNESDRRTQLNLRRIAFIILAAAEDTSAPHVEGISEKLTELVTATSTSSPSSATRAEVFMVLRALILKFSSASLSAVWPLINTELRAALTSVLPESRDKDHYNSFSLIQASKLLDELLVVAPEEFQLHEWLFITDTIDAVYRPTNWQPISLVDSLSERLGESEGTERSNVLTRTQTSQHQGDSSTRRPLLYNVGESQLGETRSYPNSASTFLQASQYRLV